MGSYVKRFGFPQAAATFSLVVGLIGLTGLPLLATNKPFSVPDDVAVRIRLDDTLTSTDSQIGDPFSATVVDKGDYQNARVYGHVAQIDMSGKIKGHTSMMLRFDRFVMPDGRRAQITRKLSSFITRPQAKRSTWKEQLNLAGEAARPLRTQPSAREQARCLAAFSAAARAPVLVPSSAASADWEQRLSTDDRRSV